MSQKRQLDAYSRGEHPTLTVRHFFYDWNTEGPPSLKIERIGGPFAFARSLARPGRRRCRNWSRWVSSVDDNLKFFLDFGEAPPLTVSCRESISSAMGVAAENRPVIGSLGRSTTTRR